MGHVRAERTDHDPARDEANDDGVRTDPSLAFDHEVLPVIYITG
jgi:hypothetical protein